MIFKCSEFKLHGKYFDNLSENVESNSINEAAEYYLREKFNSIGYPRRYNFYIKDENNEIIIFETTIDLNAEIKKTGILDLPS